MACWARFDRGTGYFRLALAQKNMQKFDAALETIKKGLTVDFGNNDLKTMRKEVRGHFM